MKIIVLLMLSCITSCVSVSSSRTSSFKLEGKDENIVLHSYRYKSNFSKSRYFVLYRDSNDANHPLLEKKQQDKLNSGKNPWRKSHAIQDGFWTVSIIDRSINRLTISDQDKDEVIRYFADKEKTDPFNPVPINRLNISNSLYYSLPIISIQDEE